MVGKTMRSSNGHTTANPVPDIKERLGDLGADLITLSELQMELLAVDTREATKKAVLPLVLTFVSAGLLLGMFPLALLAFTWWLSDAYQLSRAASALTVVGITLAVSIPLILAATYYFRKIIGLLKRSQSELKNNIQWLKNILSEKHRYQ